jgi:hypothetical protein
MDNCNLLFTDSEFCGQIRHRRKAVNYDQITVVDKLWEHCGKIKSQDSIAHDSLILRRQNDWCNIVNSEHFFYLPVFVSKEKWSEVIHIMDERDGVVV